jgi:hypothetical protein
MMPDWLEEQINEGHRKGMIIKDEDVKKKYIEVEEGILNRLEDSPFYLSKILLYYLIFQIRLLRGKIINNLLID